MNFLNLVVEVLSLSLAKWNGKWVLSPRTKRERQSERETSREPERERKPGPSSGISICLLRVFTAAAGLNLSGR